MDYIQINKIFNDILEDVKYINRKSLTIKNTIAITKKKE